MSLNKGNILSINAGSSSIKFVIYQTDSKIEALLTGSIQNIGAENVSFTFSTNTSKEQTNLQLEKKNSIEAAKYLVDWLQLQPEFHSVNIIGHRLVHGMEHTKSERITDQLLDELKEICVFDTEHLSVEIAIIEMFAQHFPAMDQVACFDTAFHSEMPNIAKQLSIPRKYFDRGIHRFGFHGLSYSYLMQELERSAGKEIANGKIILAHLGSGASLAAVGNGKCKDTSMGLTPTGGLIMSTRTGDLDPGIALYLMEVEKLTVPEFNQMINQESGLLGISGTTSDMQQLIKIKDSDAHAADAFNLFCYQTKKFVGAYAAVLEGLETLVFTGGIGEHSPEVRSQICDGLEFLGIEMDEIKNMNNEAIVSTVTSKVTVRVIKTNEELMIATLVLELTKKNNL